eukprot:Em0014g585a
MEDPNDFIFPKSSGLNGSLEEFLYTAKQLRLPVTSGQCHRKMAAAFGMNPKKAHEVEEASQLISTLAVKHGLKQVLDLGSGKGYLSEHLALKYGLAVVGVDSQSSNTHGAQCRNMKVCKVWQSISKQDRQITHMLASDGPVTQAAGHCKDPEESKLDPVLDEKLHVQENKINIVQSEMSVPASFDCSFASYTLDQEGAREHSYFPLTMTVDVSSASELLPFVERHSSGHFQQSQPCMIVGLHTCGDLAVNILRLFCDISAIKAVCVVGCCYNHCTENEDCTDGSKPGFPVSTHLRSIGAHLGRTARLLAGQNLYKFSDATKDIAMESLFFRALLQLILRDKFGATDLTNSSKDYCVSKLKYSRGDFCSYVKQALIKLKLDASKITNEEIHLLHAEHYMEMVYLQKFVQLQGALSPCIESLIILDRLLFIQENVS